MARARERIVGELVHDAELQGDGGLDHTGAHDELHGAAGADQPGQALRTAAAGDDPQADLGEAVAVVTVLPDADVAGEGELESPAHRVAVHRDDDRLGKVAEHQQQRVVAARERCAGHAHGVAVTRRREQLFHAVVREERPAIAAAAEDDRADRGVAPLLDQPGQFLRALRAEVVHRRVVVGRNDDAADLLGAPQSRHVRIKSIDRRRRPARSRSRCRSSKRRGGGYDASVGTERQTVYASTRLPR
jgi:hypothetical protein